MCCQAGKGRSVTVIEHCEKAGKKILISGAEDAISQIECLHENFISNNPHFCKSSFVGLQTSNDFISLVEKYGLSYNEKNGQLFCNSNKSIYLICFRYTDNRVEIKPAAPCKEREVSKVICSG